ncbi:MAG: T9SS type A sorting domain-containing protein [Chitinophagales bacterium]
MNAYNNLTVSIFKDDTPCDGNPIVRTVIYETNDCAAGDAINSQVTLLIGDVVPINVPNSLYDDLDTGTTYIIQIDVSAPQVSEGSIVIEKICKGRDFELPPLGSTSSNGYCTTIDNWRHYFNDNGTTAATGNTYPEYPNFWEDDILIFSVFPNGNTMDGVATINVLPNYTSAEDIPNAATYTMRRYWDFDVTSGSIDPAFPVGVKFYYDQSEKDEIIAAAQTFALFPGLVIEPFEWFKTQNGVDFDPSQVHPRYIESKQWSETGQFTPFVFTDFSGVGHFAQDYDEDNTNITCNGIQYVEMQGLTGFSGGTGASGASDSLQSPLPVELISFVGWNDAEVNELEWITASEINNDLFVVERSIDAISFTEIGTVDGSGTTTEEQTYNFTDVSPIEGINYYRLKQIDFDGSFEYSDIIAIELSGGILKTAIVKLHPNPTNRVINIQLQSANNTEFEMNVLDITGRLMETKSITAVKGLNSPFALNVEEYRSGVYIISLFDVNSGQRLEAKFVRE